MISRRLKKIFFAALWLFVITQAYIMGYVYHRIAHASIDLEISSQIAKRASASAKLLAHAVSLSSIESGNLQKFRRHHFINALQSRIEEMIYFFERTDYEGLTHQSCALAREAQAYYQHKSFSNPVLPLEGDARSALEEEARSAQAALTDARSASADILWEDWGKKFGSLLEKKEAYVLVDLEELIQHCANVTVRDDSSDDQ